MAEKKPAKAKKPEIVARSPKPKKPAKAKKPTGRPSKYTQELADEICEMLAMGYSIRTVCRPEHMPSIQTFFRWLRMYPEFNEQYAHAKQEAADAMAEDILDIADDGTNDWMEKQDASGDMVGWMLNGEHVQRSKLRIESRKWLMAKMKPRKYGDKLDMTTNGNDIGVTLNAQQAEQLLRARAKRADQSDS